MCDITSCINFVQKSSFSERVFLKLYFIESHFLSFYSSLSRKTNLASWENYPAKLLWHQRPNGSFRNDVGCCILSVISTSIDSHRFLTRISLNSNLLSLIRTESLAPMDDVIDEHTPTFLWQRMTESFPFLFNLLLVFPFRVLFCISIREKCIKLS